MSIITLPRSAVKEITDEYIKVEINETFETLIETDLDVINSTFGLLKGREIEPLKFQRKMRDEWNRDFRVDE
ncbi:MAG: hypothetical protein L3J41_05210 [Melioribacteraceae bacterium]|nr:hypothetical protein [Melioribacteraceae bacterium]